MIGNVEKPKSEARLRYEKARDWKIKKHQKDLDREVEILRRQYDRNKIS